MHFCETAITGLSEIVARAKLMFPIVLEWRNWQTQQTQNAFLVTSTFSIITDKFKIQQPLGCISHCSYCEGFRGILVSR